MQFQDITTVVNINFPLDLGVNNEDIYIDGLFNDRIKTTLGDMSPVPFSVIDSGPIIGTDLIVHNDILYFARLDGLNIFLNRFNG